MTEPETVGQSAVADRFGEAGYRSFIRKVRTAIVIHDVDGQILDCNPMAETLLGFPIEQLRQKDIGSSWDFIFGDGSHMPFESYPISQVLATHVSVTGQMLGIRRAGKSDIAWVLVNAEPDFDANGELTAVIVSFVDVSDQKRADELLQQQLRVNRAIFQQGVVSHALLDRQYRIVQVNDSYARWYGKRPEEFVGQSAFDYLSVAENDIDTARAIINHVVSTKSEVRQPNYPYVFPNAPHLGVTYWDTTLQPIFDQQGDVEFIFFSAVEITERRRAEEALEKLNRELRAISDCNQTMVRADDEQSLLEDICRIICEEAGYHMAWVGYALEDEAKTVRPVAFAGHEEGYLANINVTWKDEERGRGPTGSALRTGELVYIQDFLNDPRTAGWKEQAANRGYRSSISLPLKDSNGRSFGVLTIYSTESYAFTAAEVRLLEELAGDLAFGIVVLRTREEHRRAEQDRIENLRFFESMERVTQAIQGREGLDELMSDVLEVVLNVFESDRAWLVYPCDADAEKWRIPMERTRPEYPGGNAYDLEIPMDPEVQRVIQILRSTPDAITFGPGCEHPMPASPDDHLGTKSMLAMAVYPIGDRPYMFGLHQCSHARVWTPDECRLLREIGRRLTDALTGVLSYRDLKESESKYRALAENAPDVILRYDLDLRRIYANPAYERETGNTVESSLNTTPDVNWRAETPVEEYNRHLRMAIESGISSEMLVSWINPVGEPTTHFLRIVPERTVEGKIVGVLAIGRNITAMIQAEDEILKLNQELEHRVTERTAQLEASNRELEAFSYSVSHDLRAPLRHIDGYSKILMQDYADKLDDEARNGLQRIRAATRKMDQLIDALLQLSRVTRTPLSRTSCDLSQMVQEVAADLMRAEAHRQVEFVISPNCWVNVDPSLMRIAMENIVGNAWKYTGRNPKALIEFRVEEVGRERIFCVRDNGVGFDMTYVKQLFGAFQRLHNSTEFAGTGIGLATVQRIINRHEGRVWIEGELDQGATLYFTLANGAESV